MSKISAWTRQWASSEGHALWYEPRTSSTNDIAKEHDDFQIFVTNHQTAGRGRGENTWSDDAEGGNLIASWKLKLQHPPQAIAGPVFGLALYRATSKTWMNYDFALKAPNDLYLDGKKVAGILLESISQGGDHELIFGLGLNVTSHPDSFKDSVAEGFAATSLETKTEVTETVWTEFLSNLQLSLNWAAIACVDSQMSAATCDELCAALNRNPHLKEKFASVGANGDLKTAEKTVAWTSL